MTNNTDDTDPDEQYAEHNLLTTDPSQDTVRVREIHSNRTFDAHVADDGIVREDDSDHSPAFGNGAYEIISETPDGDDDPDDTGTSVFEMDGDYYPVIEAVDPGDEVTLTFDNRYDRRFANPSLERGTVEQVNHDPKAIRAVVLTLDAGDRTLSVTADKVVSLKQSGNQKRKVGRIVDSTYHG